MVNFKKVTIRNFMSIGEAEVNLSTGGFTLIDAINNRVEDSAGSNGSGKSSIAESILWCLTGETIRGHKEVVNRYTEGNCEVLLEFEFQGQNWAVERSMSRSKEKSLKVYKNSNLLEAKGYRDAQEVLQKELPELTSKFINSVIILGQGLPGRFTNNTPSGRKAVLEELTNADFMITQIKEKIKFRSELLAKDLRLHEDDLLKYNTRSSLISDRLKSRELQLSGLEDTDMSAYKLKQDELNLKVDSLTSQLKANEEELIKALDRSNQARDLWRSRESKLEVELSAISGQLAEDQAAVRGKYSKELSEETLSLRERMLKGKQIIKETEDKLMHNRAKVSGGICKTCGQRLPSISEEEILTAKKAAEDLELKLSQYRDLYKQLNDQEVNISVDLNNKEFEELSKLKSLADENSTRVSKAAMIEIGRLKSEYDKARDESSRISNRRGQISDDLDLAKDALRSVISKLENHQKDIDLLKEGILSDKSELVELSSLREDEESKIEDLKSRISVVKQMETFASRDFRGILLEGIISRMDEIVGNYAEVVYGNRLTSFYLDGNSIQIEFDGKEYESLSGGEQQKMNVILQLSLRDLIVEITGNTGSILFLDEIFDGLDSVGCQKMVELVQKLDISIFLISHHHEHLNLPYDYILTVVKESNGVAHIQRGI